MNRFVLAGSWKQCWKNNVHNRLTACLEVNDELFPTINEY